MTVRELLSRMGSAELAYWRVVLQQDDDRRHEELKHYGLAGL